MNRLIFLLLLISAPIQAEISKLVIPHETGMKFYWWPVLPEINGWHHDREHGLMTKRPKDQKGLTRLKPKRWSRLEPGEVTIVVLGSESNGARLSGFNRACNPPFWFEFDL